MHQPLWESGILLSCHMAADSLLSENFNGLVVVCSSHVGCWVMDATCLRPACGSLIVAEWQHGMADVSAWQAMRSALMPTAGSFTAII